MFSRVDKTQILSQANQKCKVETGLHNSMKSTPHLFFCRPIGGNARALCTLESLTKIFVVNAVKYAGRAF